MTIEEEERWCDGEGEGEDMGDGDGLGAGNSGGEGRDERESESEGMSEERRGLMATIKFKPYFSHLV